jgi:ABC-type bacteriocin/lantibiotic exporter with double-glycine peptidase domain
VPPQRCYCFAPRARRSEHARNGLGLRRFLAPEVVQTSSLDCGPAALKCLLEGFGTKVSYGRLREACQTGLDGTSIDTIEVVAQQLGLEAEQIMLPVDHLLLPESQTLPAIVVVTKPSGLTHFVVVWRRHGKLLQIMDPAVGRRWMLAKQLAAEIYRHRMPVEAAGWYEFACSASFQEALSVRLERVGLRAVERRRVIAAALSTGGWHEIAALDAATRLLASLAQAGGLPGGRHRCALLERLCAHPELLPAPYWSAMPLPANEGDEDESAMLLMRGAVLVRVRTTKKNARRQISAEALGPELASAIASPSLHPARALWDALRETGSGAPLLLLLGLLAAGGGTFIEALLFRGLLDINAELHIAGQRMGALAALLLFSLAMLLLDVPVFASSLRLGRHIENRLRVLFLEKIPKLGDRYFQSRLTSDMAERSHATHRLRQFPPLLRQFLSSLFQLLATAGGIVWLEPQTWPLALGAVAAAILPALGAQTVLAERDLRARTHAGGLMRFYLDAMLGLLAIRAHAAERSVQREQEKLLGEWASASLKLQRAIVACEALQLLTTFGLIAALLLTRPLEGTEAGRVLLLAYWALNLPVLGQELGALARQYPSTRNLTLRLLEPLGAPEENTPAAGTIAPYSSPPGLTLRDVSVQISGHTILSSIDLELDPGKHVAVVGPSGAGKSSLVGLLLGWHKASQGEVLVDGAPLDIDRLRLSTAWVDPAVQLWNRSLFDNLQYGSEFDPSAVGDVIDAALLRSVLESLPEGMQTVLGEGGALVSGGEGQRVRLARALLRKNVRLVVLDEPFRGLDREKRRELLARARQLWRGATLLCVTHDLGETLAFDRVLVIEAGRLIEDGVPQQLQAKASSRYAQMLAAERQIQSELWAGNMWRRMRLEAGQIVEELPRQAEERRASEVA